MAINEKLTALMAGVVEQAKALGLDAYKLQAKFTEGTIQVFYINAVFIPEESLRLQRHNGNIQ